MIEVLEPGKELATANFVLAMAGAFTLGLPLLLINGYKVSTKERLVILTPEELAYEVEIFGWLPE